MSSNGKTGTTLQIFISSQKFNNYGRYLSVTAVQRQRSSVIIVPENTFNAGSKDVATNMAGFTTKRTLITCERTTTTNRKQNEC